MPRPTPRRFLAPATVVILLAAATPAGAQLPGLPGGLPCGLPGGLPCGDDPLDPALDPLDPALDPLDPALDPLDPPVDLPPVTPPPVELPVDPPVDLPVDLPGPGSGDPSVSPGGGSPEGGSPSASPLDAGGPVISGPSKARTTRVDAKGRFHLKGVAVRCPNGCKITVIVSTANAGTVRFVKRTFRLAPGGKLKLRKLKVSKKGLKALRSTGIARVVASVRASGDGQPVTRGVGLKLKPAKPRRSKRGR